MFLNKTYIEVNREERHYCSLFAHALLSSEIVRTRFSEIISSKCEKIKLNPTRMEVFIEVAALRDYWNALYDDNSNKLYNENTHANRRGVLDEILKLSQFDPGIIDIHSFFWTKGINTKLWNPGHWSVPAIEQSGIKNKDELINSKWAFNAKPDMMIISNNHAILVEAKLESIEGKYGRSGEDQEKIQKRIGCLLKKLVPAFQQVKFCNMLLAKHPPKGNKWPLYATWEDIIGIISKAQLDKFTEENFDQLRTRYYSDKL